MHVHKRLNPALNPATESGQGRIWPDLKKRPDFGRGRTSLVELGGGEHNEPERRQAASSKHWKRAVSSSRHDCAQLLDGKINAPFIFNKFNTHFHIMSNTSEPTCIRMTKMTVKNDSRSTVDIKYYVTGNKNQADASNQAYPQGQALHQQNDHLLYAFSQSSPHSRQLSRSLFYIGLFFIMLK
ncbi:hypothetical protein HELRODRAFT_170039 [Helobdella robusta]|uniref:Uncharacterized protein n=1 Tax=Helobdella robusta TaxID=6412 RepID=T1F2K3_HELRO|nr:hypothetical protein HELRODRAFT_170039 [Helobdella robusta]ESO07502.1 hypothetical protein HELRODRAFT_170039 [Helobdella robusta]